MMRWDNCRWHHANICAENATDTHFDACVHCEVTKTHPFFVVWSTHFTRNADTALERELKGASSRRFLSKKGPKVYRFFFILLPSVRKRLTHRNLFLSQSMLQNKRTMSFVTQNPKSFRVCVCVCARVVSSKFT